MFETVSPDIFGDVKAEDWLAVEYTLAVAEGDIAMDVETFDKEHPDGHVGIYPSTEKFGREVTLRLRYPPGREDLSEAFTSHVMSMAARLGVKPI